MTINAPIKTPLRPFAKGDVVKRRGSETPLLIVEFSPYSLGAWCEWDDHAGGVRRREFILQAELTRTGR